MHKIINHPLVKDKLTRMRKEDTTVTAFRSNLEELTQLMVYEATKNYAICELPITTPVGRTTGYKLRDKINIVPILRAGLGMADGVKSLIPTASIGHIGLYRDEETLKPIKYYSKFPKNISEANVLVLDPMLATGGSAIEAINIVKEKNPKSIQFIAIVAAPEGLAALEKAHPDVEIYLADLDQKLDKNGYIVPGLGDAGDRIFGTK